MATVTGGSFDSNGIDGFDSYGFDFGGQGTTTISNGDFAKIVMPASVVMAAALSRSPEERLITTLMPSYATTYHP
jgi:hypothetical protein